MLAIGFAGFSQATYYWVGGPNGALSTAASWNTALDGSGTDRTPSDPGDVLIFDGSNIGGSVPATGNVIPVIDGSLTVRQLFFQNGANVTLKRNTLSTSGTSNIKIEGDGNPVTDDFLIDATSTVAINADATGYGTNLVIGELDILLATGRIFGTLNIADGGFATTKITVSNPAALRVETGGQVSSQTTFAGNYPFGTGTSSTPTASLGTVFNSGSKLIYVSGVSVLGNTAAFQPAKFNAGSTLEMNANNPAGMFNSKTYANIVVKSPAVVTLTETFFNIDTLTINSGATFNMRTTGSSPVSGDIINNGTFGAGAPTSANLVMIGTVPQTIRGSGTFNSLGAFAVGTDAEVILNRSLNIIGTSTSNITGKLNTQANVISGTGAFQLRTANAGTPAAATITAASNSVVLTDATAYNAANVSIGARVVGPAFEPNTYVIATSSGTFTFTISKPAITSFPALSGTVTLTTLSPTLETAHAAGVDGTITTSGSKTFGTGVNYIFDAATTTPFAAAATSTAGNVTLNASVTTNKTIQKMDGILTINTGILTIRSSDTMRLMPGSAIAGAPFSASKYVRTSISGGNVGVLRIDNFSTATMFPVGTATNYLPVMLSPTSPMDYAVSVFEGVTTDGTPGATAVSAGEKAKIVDAVWTINRPNGTGDCGVQLNWTAPLEGAIFSGLPDGQIGISRYDGAEYSPAIGSGNNSTNIASAVFDMFSPFIVSQAAVVLPVQLKSIAASIKTTGVEVSWQVANEEGIARYEVERSTDRNVFSAIGAVAGASRSSYAFNDGDALKGVVYYRLKIVSVSGDVKYSSIVAVKLNGNVTVRLFPNPVADVVNFSGLSANTIIRISNASGKLVLSQKTNASAQNLDISAFAKGIYVAEIFVDGKRVETLTFSKQ